MVVRFFALSQAKGLSMRNIQTLTTVDAVIISKIALLYCQVWKEPPWNEDFWREEEVSQTIADVLRDKSAIIQYCSENEILSGFCWGYVIDREKTREISGNQLLDEIFSSGKKVFYIAELAVNIGYRKHGIGRQLTQTLLQKLSATGYEIVCLRTDVQAHEARRLYQRLGFQELAIHDAKHLGRTYWLLSL